MPIKNDRATKEELERRIFMVQGWIIEGVSEFLIKKQAVTQWGVSFRTAKRYMKTAFDGIKPDLERTIEDKRAGKVAELEQRKRNIEQRFRHTPEGIRVMNDIDKMIIRLESLEPAKELMIKGDAKQPLHHQVEIKVVNTGFKIANSEDDIDV
jgi:hypothetical protein